MSRSLSLRLLAAALTVLAVLALSACGGQPTQTSTPTEPEAPVEQSTPQQTEPTATPSEPSATEQGPHKALTQKPEMPKGNVTKLQKTDIVVGTGAQAKSGSRVTVDYTGWLTDGTQFDSSLRSGQPFPFTIGAGEVIKGWDEGVAGMKVGGVRKLVIPADLGYGPQGTPGGPIPPNATLVFVVQLRAVE
jgi:FKBP-type peptidyl-prolyl cis-trans isomerase